MLRLIVTLPFLAALIIFAVYNQEIVTLSVPGYSRQSSLAVLVIIVAVVFFLIGGLAVWFAELRQRRRARRAEQQLHALETQVAELRLQLAHALNQNNLVQAGVPPALVQTRSPYASPTSQPPSIV